jgi:hypothetical protein
MAGLIAVEHRLVWQGPLEFQTGGLDGLTRFFPRRLRTAQTDRDVQRVGQQCLHQPPGHATHHRQVRDQRGELWAELADDVRGQGRVGRLPARRTHDGRTLIFRDVGVDRRQFRDLMAPGRPGHRASARAQCVVAVATRVRKDFDGLIHTLGRYQRPAVSGVAELATGFAPTLRPASPLPLDPRQAVGRRWLRGGRRVLLSQGELSFQIGDLLRLFGDFVAELLVFLRQPLDFVCPTAVTIQRLLRGTRSSNPRPSRPRNTHAPYGTLMMSACTP